MLNVEFFSKSGKTFTLIEGENISVVLELDEEDVKVIRKMIKEVREK